MLKKESGIIGGIKKNIVGLSVFVAVFMLIAAGVYISGVKTIEKMPYNGFIDLVEKGEVAVVTLKDTASIRFESAGKTYETDNPRRADFKEYLLIKNIEVLEGGASAAVSFGQAALSVLILGGVFFFVYRMSSRAGGKSEMAMELSAESSADGGEMTFQDVAGNAEAKESVADVVDFIREPEKYSAYGARMPKGLIFYGPPGTGKTLLAKAIAGEAGVPFYAVSGSDFVQMYVGVGAGRIRELFKKARSHGKAVVFIDEIDALGKKRGGQNGGNDERDQTLNALLTEMSGFNSAEGIVVIAATNRLDTLDEALLRPGRFDRQIEISLPDVSAREKILRHHSRNKPIAKDVDLKALAVQTVYFSGAMLENLLNESAIFAVKRNGEEIEGQDIDKAYYTIIAGSEKKDRSGVRQKDKEVTAFHEAGHALVTKLAAPENTVSKVTIIPSTKGAGGFCINIPPDKMFYTKKELEAQVMVSLGGRAAEEIVFGKENITTGASNDIEKAAGIIEDYVMKYGMGTDLFPGGLDDEKTRDECIRHLDRLYGSTIKVIEENTAKLNAIARLLIEEESINEGQLESIVHDEAI